MGEDPHLDAKDPDDSIWYQIEWDEEIASTETLSSASWTVPTGLTEVSSSVSGTKALIRLSSGTAGTEYTLVCQITKDTGETVSKAISIPVAEAAT